MHWRFDPLFSIKIVHSKNPLVNAEDFDLEPTQGTAQRLKALNWICKSQAGYCTVYGQKVFEANGDAVLRGQASNDESFTFFLNLNNPEILNLTKPYVLSSNPVIVPNPNLPAFSGRTRLLYFDNLNPVPLSGAELSLSTGEVDIDQFASSAPTVFDFDQAKPGVNSLKFTALTPSSTITQINLHPQLHNAQVELEENTYRVDQIPGGPSETMVLMRENVHGNVLGMIRIFPSATGWEPVRRFRIDFEKV